MSTNDNIREAFAGESQANRRYLTFAGRADKDGLPQVARLFRAAAAAEAVHAENHLRAMDGVGDTASNLKEAIAGEAEEFERMYPGFLDQARAEGHKPAEKSFRHALAVEEIHHGLYEKALAAVEAGGDLDETPIFVCPVCGNTVEGEPPGVCPICGVPGSKFARID